MRARNDNWGARALPVFIAAMLLVSSCATYRPAPASAPAVANPKIYLADVSAELTKCWPTNRTVNIVCHGHSVPAGYFRTPAVHTFEAYPYLLHRGLAKRFPHAVINVIVAGIGGENAEQGAERFKRDVLCKEPDVVTIDYGLNDRAIGLKRSETAWRKMIEMALAQHVKVILLTPTPDMTAHLDDPNDALNQHARQIRRLAAKYHVGLVDSLKLFEAKIKAGTPLKDLMAQSNHPNFQGHKIVAAGLLEWFPKPGLALSGARLMAPGAIYAPPQNSVILTPPPPNEPRINGPEVYGVRPGSPFLYRIPCTGKRPISFHAEGLPKGLTLNAASGIITGEIAKPGTIQVTLFARNVFGKARREFRIEVGNKLALTPPMGWNSWYIYLHHVTQAKMCKAADEMIASGMADYGYQYVNIDDCWARQPGLTNSEVGEPVRDTSGQILPNQRFPDIKAMVDYIHAKGLKTGIYTSPGPKTCGGFEGSWQHEAQDARTFADWGFDFLKYDWCSYGKIFLDGDPRLTNTISVQGAKGLAGFKFPYELMSRELQKQHRDIVFNLCQYGLGEVWKWGGDVGNCWRTTDDLGHAMDLALARGAKLPGFYDVAFSNETHWQYARPGAWNDPDYILIGWIGANHGKDFKQTTLTPNEQYSYMSLWSLMAAPLIYSGDMTRLDAFTLNVLCNAEVIAVDQDPLGRQARALRQTPDEYVLVKELEDGSKAVGLFNLSSLPRTISVSWNDLGISGKQTVRDLWRQKEIGSFNKIFEAEVPRHGVALLRLRPEK
jgi:alpha-galactosidase